MNTTEAATQANVTVATIRTWCRKGVITATKQAGRWIIDTASLTRRIEIGARMSRPTTRYTVTEGANQYGTTTYTVTRTDGTPATFSGDMRIYGMTYLKREQAEIAATILEQLPEEYRIAKQEVRFHRSSINENYWVWEVTGGTDDDPKPLKERVRVDSTSDVAATLLGFVRKHADGRAQRIAEKAEKDVIEAAERQVREAQEKRRAGLIAEKGALATPKQVDYILKLLARREHLGEGGGFFYGPTDRAGIEEMSKADASTYITSLKGDY